MTNKTDDYIFANAYLGCFVSKLMTKQDMMRVASSKDLAAAEVLLQEFGYAEDRDIFNEDIEYFLREEQNKLFDLVFNTLSDRKELGMFLYPYDYHNIKVFLKAEFLGIEADDTYLMSTSFLDVKRLEVAIRERNFLHLSANMKEAINETLDIFGRGKDPQMVDLIMDKACYKDMLKGAMRTEEEFLIDLVRLQIDLLNLKAFVRLRQIQKPWSFFKSVFLEGGNISDKFFITAYEEPFLQIADKLAPYGLREVMAEGGTQIKDTGDFTLFERMSENKVMEWVKKAKYLSEGLAPIAAYWIAKETEIDNIRIILSGKLADLPAELIVERLRETYV